jgi:hypothetical protein
MSILKSKHSGWLSDGTRTPFGGSSGGGGGPTQSTTYSSNVPEYARPYVENMLQSAQTQIYNDDMTSFRPYQPYSSDVNNYFAGFSPLQQQAQQSAYYLQTPSQFALGSGLAGTAGIEALGTQGQAGFLGNEALGYGAAGQTYGDIGTQQALQRAQQTGRQAGLYGGLGAGYGAQAAGLAPTAQAFGQEAADIGMGGIGYGALGTGYGMRGAQAAEQVSNRKINQAIQDYATAQQYPMMQLSMMNSLLRGLPMQSTTTQQYQQYQAQPGTAQQALGLGLGALGAYKAFG